VHFIIGGDGPKKAILEEMRKKYNLSDRMELLGRIPHS
jgi:phosphatidylinositol glycan class A protein